MKKRVSKRLPGDVRDTSGVIQRDQGLSAPVSRRRPRRPSMSLKATPPAASAAACRMPSASTPWANRTPHSSKTSRTAATWTAAAVAASMSCSCSSACSRSGAWSRCAWKSSRASAGSTLPPGKTKEPPWHVRQRMALDHQHLGPGGPSRQMRTVAAGRTGPPARLMAWLPRLSLRAFDQEPHPAHALPFVGIEPEGDHHLAAAAARCGRTRCRPPACPGA